MHSLSCRRRGCQKQAWARAQWRRSGAIEGFAYSDPLKSAGIVWSEATFKEFMPNPMAKVPGTRMIVSVRADKDVANLWAYLKQFGPDGKMK